MGSTFTPVQSTFRGKDDNYGLQVDNGWLAGLGLDWTQDTATVFRVRFVIQETGGKAVNNQQFQLRYLLNDTGGYLPISTTSDVVRSVISSQFADNDTTSQLIGSGTYVVGESQGADEDGTTGNIDYAGNDEAELEFCLFVPHDVDLDGDNIKLRVYKSDGTALNSYTDTPSLTVALLSGHPAAIATGNVQLGANILKTSGGTYYGVFRDGTTGIKIWKDLFGTPSSAGAATATEIHGGGSLDWISAALDSNDDIHIVSSCNAEQTRDVAYRVFDTGTDTWVGSWDELYNYTGLAGENTNHIAIDANDDAHVVCCDLQTAVDQVFYTNNISGWLTPERVNTSTTLMSNDPIIVCDPTTSTDVHVFYYSDGNNDPAYRKRTSGSWGTLSTLDYTSYSNVFGLTVTPGGTRYGYAISAFNGANDELEDIHEGINEAAGTDLGYNTPRHVRLTHLAGAVLDGTDRYIAYVQDPTNAIHVLSNTGSGWTNEGEVIPGIFVRLATYWAAYNYNFTNEFCFLFDDGVSVYAGAFAISGGDQTVPISDAGGGADVVSSLTVSLAVAETGSGVMTLSPAASVPTVDVGGGIDSIADILASVPIADTGTGTDIATLVAKILAITDTGNASDFISNIDVNFIISDTGTGAETLTIIVSLTVSDAGSGLESIDILTALLKEVGDAGSGIESLLITNAFTLGDTGTGTAIPQISQTLLQSDAGAGADVISLPVISVPIPETGAGADELTLPTISVPIPDAGSGTEAQQISVVLSVPDVGSAVDAVDVIKALLKQVADAGSGIGSISISTSLAVADAGAGTDSLQSIAASLTVTDVGSAIDAINVISAALKQIGDVGAGADAITNITASVQVTETGAGAEAIPISVSLAIADTATGIDAIDIAIQLFKQVADTAQGTDNVLISAQVAVTDLSAATDLIAEILVHALVQDVASAIEAIGLDTGSDYIYVTLTLSGNKSTVSIGRNKSEIGIGAP